MSEYKWVHCPGPDAVIVAETWEGAEEMNKNTIPCGHQHRIMVKTEFDQRLSEAEKALKLMIASCGHTDAAEGCRLTIKTGKEALTKEGK